MAVAALVLAGLPMGTANHDSPPNGIFSRRGEIDITNTGPALTDQQVLVTLDTASLIAAGNMQPDCDDIQFTLDDGTTVLPHWLAGGCDTASTKIWVKVPSLPTGTTTIFLFFDTNLAASTSDMEATMVLGEAGTLELSDTIDSDVSETVELANSIADPVVVAYVATRNGGDSLDVRVDAVGSTGFDIFVEEPNGGPHVSEDVGWVALPSGSFVGGDDVLRVEAGTHTTSSVHEGPLGAFGGDAVAFDNAFTATPSVLATLNTYGNGDFMSDHTDDLATTGFDLQQEAAETGNAASEETIGWVALSRDAGTLGAIQYEVGLHPEDGDLDGVDDTAELIDYDDFDDPPALIVQGSTANGPNGYWARGAGVYDEAEADVFAEEDQVGDAERAHADEAFSFAAFGTGVLPLAKFAPDVSAGSLTDVVLLPEAGPICRVRDDPIEVDNVDPTVTLDGLPTVEPTGKPIIWQWETSTGDTVPDPALFNHPDGLRSWHAQPVPWTPPGGGAFTATLLVVDDDGFACSKTADVLVDDALGVTAGRVPGPVSPIHQAVLFADVFNEAGDPVEGATVWFNVSYSELPLVTLTGVSSTSAVTDAAGHAEIVVPFDTGGAPGVNLLGEHRVDVTVLAPNLFPHDLDGDAGDLERVTTRFTYDVPPLP